MAKNNFFIPGGIRFTAEGGLAVLLTNKTGANSIKGYLVRAHGSVEKAVELIVKGDPDPFGVFYDSGIPDGSEAWVVFSGLADVYFTAVGSTMGYFARNLLSGDTGDAGQILSEAVPTSPFSTDKHFLEIGHILETRVGAGLARVIMHFN